MNVDDAPARAFFMGLVDGTPYNMLVHPDVNGRVSLQLKHVTVEEVAERRPRPVWLRLSARQHRLHGAAGEPADAHVPSQLPRPEAPRRFEDAHQLGPDHAESLERRGRHEQHRCRGRHGRQHDRYQHRRRDRHVGDHAERLRFLGGHRREPARDHRRRRREDGRAQRRRQQPVGRGRRARDAERAARRRRLPREDREHGDAPGRAGSEDRRGRAQRRLPGRHQLGGGADARATANTSSASRRRAAASTAICSLRPTVRSPIGAGQSHQRLRHQCARRRVHAGRRLRRLQRVHRAARPAGPHARAVQPARLDAAQSEGHHQGRHGRVLRHRRAERHDHRRSDHDHRRRGADAVLLRRGARRHAADQRRGRRADAHPSRPSAT